MNPLFFRKAKNKLAHAPTQVYKELQGLMGNFVPLAAEGPLKMPCPYLVRGTNVLCFRTQCESNEKMMAYPTFCPCPIDMRINCSCRAATPTRTSFPLLLHIFKGRVPRGQDQWREAHGRFGACSKCMPRGCSAWAFSCALRVDIHDCFCSFCLIKGKFDPGVHGWR